MPLVSQSRLAAKLNTFCFGLCDSVHLPLSTDIILKLGKSTQHVEHQLAFAGAGVDRLVQQCELNQYSYRAWPLSRFFAAGWSFGSTEVSERVTSGLVQALNSVRTNLFGSEIFAVGIIDPDIYPPDPINEARAVQLDFSDASEIPFVLNLFHLPDPVEPICRPYAQIMVSPSDGVALPYDPELVVPEALEPNEPFFGHPPDPCRDDIAIISPE